MTTLDKLLGLKDPVDTYRLSRLPMESTLDCDLLPEYAIPFIHRGGHRRRRRHVLPKAIGLASSARESQKDKTFSEPLIFKIAELIPNNVFKKCSFLRWYFLASVAVIIALSFVMPGSQVFALAFIAVINYVVASILFPVKHWTADRTSIGGSILFQDVTVAVTCETPEATERAARELSAYIAPSSRGSITLDRARRRYATGPIVDHVDVDRKNNTVRFQLMCVHGNTRKTLFAMIYEMIKDVPGKTALKLENSEYFDIFGAGNEEGQNEAKGMLNNRVQQVQKNREDMAASAAEIGRILKEGSDRKAEERKKAKKEYERMLAEERAERQKYLIQRQGEIIDTMSENARTIQNANDFIKSDSDFSFRFLYRDNARQVSRARQNENAELMQELKNLQLEAETIE